MEKIELTPAEIEAIEVGERMGVGYDPVTEEEKRAMMSVIDKAEALMRKLNAYDELNGNLVLWFYNKYKEQQAQNV